MRASLNYQYDPAGNLTEVSVANMHTRYEGWQEGFPAQMTWGDGTAFTVTKENGLLKSISSTDNFELSLEYETGGNGLSEDCDQAVNYSGAKLTRVTRAGPDLRETLVPSYNPNHTLGEVRVTREIADTSNGPQKAPETLSFTESYGNGDKQLLTQLTLVLHDQPSPSGSGGLVDIQLRGRSTVQGEGGRIAQQTSEAPRAVVQPADPETTHQVDWTYQPENGNLTQVDAVSTNKQHGRYEWDGFRRLRAIERADGSRIEYAYDSGHRRIRAATEGNQTPLIFSYQGSKLIAVGRKEGDGERWTHAVAHGPFGPAFIVDLENQNNSYYLFNDHLGTPFAYKRVGDGKVFYTPTSPYGETWSDRFEVAGGDNTGPASKRTTNYHLDQGFEQPPFNGFDQPFLGLSGHMRDQDTGLVYMHHRYYSPELGHFLNPDFRAPNIYDPSTFTEPYAFAGGNPMMLWDPNGLETLVTKISKVASDMQASGNFFEKVVAHKLFVFAVISEFLAGSTDK